MWAMAASSRSMLTGRFPRTLHASTQLVLIEWLTTAVLFDQARHHQFGGFKGGKALFTGHAFAPTTYLPPSATSRESITLCRWQRKRAVHK